MGIKCFLIEPTFETQLYLRRYDSRKYDCPGKMSYHDAMVPFGICTERLEGNHFEIVNPPALPAHDDPRWPQFCECGYVFQEKDAWQLFDTSIYRRTDTGETFPLRDAPVGAIWDAFWLHDSTLCGADGKALICRLPGNHDWHIDGPCSNCPWQNDRDASHKCWVRHGEPPNITVDKNGDTCPAGGGSIQAPGWHGFLRNGELVNA